MWYDEFLAARQHCVVVSNIPLSDDAMHLVRVNSVAYRQYLLFGSPQPLFMYAVAADGCPPTPSG